MKIALAHYSSTSDISGVTSWFERFVVQLKRHGHEPIVQLNHYGVDPAKASILPKFYDAQIDVKSIKRGSNLQQDVMKTLQFLNECSPDIFLPQCLSAHYIAAKIAGEQGLPWAFTVHSDDPDYWNQLYEVLPASHNGQTVCVSELISKQVLALNIDPEPIEIPYGICISEDRSVWNEPFRVVYSGRLVESQKRMSLVVESLIMACQANPKVMATILGDGPKKTGCELAVKKAGLEDRITFTGRIPPERVSKELLNSHAILLMSDFEGLPLAILEAMSVGVVPVVRSIKSGIPQLVKNEFTGLLVDDSPITAANALIRLAKDRSLWQTCSDNARDLAKQKYSDTVSFDRWMLLIEELGQRNSVQWPLKIPEYIEIQNPQLLRGYSSNRTLWRHFVTRVKREIGSRCARLSRFL